MFRSNIVFGGLPRLCSGIRLTVASRAFKRPAALRRADGGTAATEAPSPSNEGSSTLTNGPTGDGEAKKKELAEIVEHVRVMNEYFSQYVDEYYEEEAEDGEELDEEEQAAMRRLTEVERLQALTELYERRLALPPITDLTADDLVELLRQQRAKDIVCLRMPAAQTATVTAHIVICEAHNSRHAHAMITNIRKYVKDHHRFGIHNSLPQRLRNGPAPQWFNMDLRSVMLHILTPKARAHYDLETLYGADDGDELADQFQPLSVGLCETINSLLPPRTP